ncbi:MAG: sulfite exporter TauE/SafE family protein [Candidatus Zipacnadales bacterium]
MEPSVLILPPLLGFAIGFLVGLTGLGGGALMTPALILFLKMEPVTAVGTDLIYASITKLVGAYQHIRLGNVNWRLVFYLALGSLPGALVGAVLLARLHRIPGFSLDQVLRHLLGGLLILVALVTLWRTYGRTHDEDLQELREFALRCRWVVILGVAVGILVTFTSIGSGTIVTMFLLVWFSLSVPRLVGTDITHAVILLSVAGLSHVVQGTADLKLAGLLLLGSLPGVWIGALFTGRLPERAVKTVLATLLLLSGARLI